MLTVSGTKGNFIFTVSNLTRCPAGNPLIKEVCLTTSIRVILTTAFHENVFLVFLNRKFHNNFNVFKHTLLKYEKKGFVLDKDKIYLATMSDHQNPQFPDL